MVGDMLQRNVKIFAYIGLLTHDIEKFKREIIGICVMKSNPFYAFNIGYSADKLGNMRPAVEVDTIVSKFLFNDLKLLYALCNQFLNLLKYVLYRPADVLPRDERYCAIGTMPITSFRNLDISIM